MTSANLSEEPICTDNIDARLRLAGLADAFLMHDRDIHMRTDNSVMRDCCHRPEPHISLSHPPFARLCAISRPPALESAFPAGDRRRIQRTLFASPMTIMPFSVTTLAISKTTKRSNLSKTALPISRNSSAFKPVAIACDLHPNYLATRYAQERAERENLALIPVQHHHAHIAALMAEHGLDGSEPVIGVAFDGTGYGDDGKIWGGEFLLADYAGYKRFAHLRYFPLPGGDAATRRPSRTALGLLHALGLDWDESLPTHSDLCYDDRTALRAQLEHKIEQSAHLEHGPFVRRRRRAGRAYANKSTTKPRRPSSSKRWLTPTENRPLPVRVRRWSR